MREETLSAPLQRMRHIPPPPRGVNLPRDVPPPPKLDEVVARPRALPFEQLVKALLVRGEGVQMRGEGGGGGEGLRVDERVGGGGEGGGEALVAAAPYDGDNAEFE
jgi:hypothetical protein